MTSTGSGPQTGREYRRVSVDHSGRARSTGEQHAENVRDAESVGVALGRPYEDNDRSASRYATKARDDFDRLMADLRTGQFGADVLWLWESSRGSRKVGEWVELIEECERNGVLIRVTTHSRFYDPRNPRDRRSLLEDAVDSEYESSKVSVRAKRTAAASAAEGRPHGHTPYGYRRVYHAEKRTFVGQYPHPDEAPIVVELFERLAAGHSLRSIATDFAERGIEKRSGGPFSPAHLRTLAENPAYAGLRVHQPGRKARYQPDHSGERITRAIWDGLISEALFYAVRRMLSDPSRKTSRPGRGKHLLSMIARCAHCDCALTVAYPDGHRTYRCYPTGCVRLSADDLDALATDTILNYLARKDVYEALQQESEAEAEDLAKLRDEIASIKRQLDDLADSVSRRKVSVTLAARSEPPLLADLEKAERRERELLTPAVLRGIITPGADVAEQWKNAPMSARRELARLLLRPESLGTVAVHRRQDRGPRDVRCPAEDRVTFDKVKRPGGLASNSSGRR
jgi:DNA invertase Pin-like site-specific DNA recombinase